eukprot:NODE_11976_length_454_cov_36.654434_g11953_i0.p1 GENE.NODE_11976_length_454_cov_36.654434_g11953_i0~~NODE_11976_length_454_cov_36.654434_g11953_i0.p1  ORF type:complete len:146 (+),score=45.80 NODE_11976_length_454_cov_36.654434_g11953_i0:22-438(+)
MGAAVRALDGVTFKGGDLKAEYSRQPRLNNTQVDKETDASQETDGPSVTDRERTKPGRILMVSGVKPGATREDMEDLFNRYGDVEAWELFATKNDVGTLEMDTTSHAIEAILELQGYSVAGGGKLKITFSKQGRRTDY